MYVQKILEIKITLEVIMLCLRAVVYKGQNLRQVCSDFSLDLSNLTIERDFLGSIHFLEGGVGQRN